MKKVRIANRWGRCGWCHPARHIRWLWCLRQPSRAVHLRDRWPIRWATSNCWRRWWTAAFRPFRPVRSWASGPSRSSTCSRRSGPLRCPWDGPVRSRSTDCAVFRPGSTLRSGSFRRLSSKASGSPNPPLDL